MPETEDINIVIVRVKGEYAYCKTSTFKDHLLGLARKVDTAHPLDLDQEEIAEALSNARIIIQQLENRFGE